MSAPTEYLTESRINEIKSNLNEIDGLSSKCIDELIELFKQFHKETTEKQKIGAAVSNFSFSFVYITYQFDHFCFQLDLIGLALQVPACDKPKIDLRHVLESTSHGVTDDQMIKVQDQLCELVPARRVQQAMIILHAFRVGATSDEKEDAIVSFCF